MNVREARATIRADRAAWTALVGTLRDAGVPPVVTWRCRQRGCLYLAVYPTPDGRLVLWLPPRRHSPALADRLDYDSTRTEGLAAELSTFLASTDADLFLALSCKHYEADETLARLRADAAAPGRTDRVLPDDDTPMSFVGPRSGQAR